VDLPTLKNRIAGTPSETTPWGSSPLVKMQFMIEGGPLDFKEGHLKYLDRGLTTVLIRVKKLVNLGIYGLGQESVNGDEVSALDFSLFMRSHGIREAVRVGPTSPGAQGVPRIRFRAQLFLSPPGYIRRIVEG
jgi:hypothetical protein